MQHSKTGLFLKKGGGFTRHLGDAHLCSNLAAAMVECSRARLNPGDFVYRVVDPGCEMIAPEFMLTREAA